MRWAVVSSRDMILSNSCVSGGVDFRLFGSGTHLKPAMFVACCLLLKGERGRDEISRVRVFRVGLSKENEVWIMQVDVGSPSQRVTVFSRDVRDNSIVSLCLGRLIDE